MVSLSLSLFLLLEAISHLPTCDMMGPDLTALAQSLDHAAFHHYNGEYGYADMPFPLQPTPNTCCAEHHNWMPGLNDAAFHHHNNGYQHAQHPPMSIQAYMRIKEDPRVMQALDVARDSSDGAENVVIRGILDKAVIRIWDKVMAYPNCYLLTRDEFSIFTYFQWSFKGNEVAMSARRRFWDTYRGDTYTGDGDVGM